MDGQQLYELYVSKNNQVADVTVEETWEDLDDSERSVWNAMADELN